MEFKHRKSGWTKVDPTCKYEGSGAFLKTTLSGAEEHVISHADWMNLAEPSVRTLCAVPLVTTEWIGSVFSAWFV